jgi:hypothetical protein
MRREILAKKLVSIAGIILSADGELESNDIRLMKKQIDDAYDVVHDYRLSTTAGTPQNIQLEKVEDHLGEAVREFRKLK